MQNLLGLVTEIMKNDFPLLFSVTAVKRDFSLWVYFFSPFFYEQHCLAST